MMKDLAGILMIYRGESFDYCYMEAIQCLLEFCDKVFVVDCGSDDGTQYKILNIENEKLEVICLNKSKWDSVQGREKLAYFTNIGIEAARKDGYKWVFNLQSDEILHEDSYEVVRKAIKEDIEGILCSRINLWSSPYLQLNVPPHRQPCSTKIVRLTKSYCWSVGDAESQAAVFTDKYVDDIKIYHMGFCRERVKMLDKSFHMQKEIFQVEPDVKLGDCDEFKPERWFSEGDLIPIQSPLPKVIQQWAKERAYE